MPICEDEVERIKKDFLETRSKILEFLYQNQGRYYSSREIAERLNIKESFAKKVLTELTFVYLPSIDKIEIDVVEKNGETFYGIKVIDKVLKLYEK